MRSIYGIKKGLMIISIYHIQRGHIRYQYTSGKYEGRKVFDRSVDAG